MNSIFFANSPYIRADVKKDVNTLYIFTDNTDRDSGKNQIDPNSWYAKKYGPNHHYPTMTTAVIRGLDNARPISTQHYYHTGAKGIYGRWHDEEAAIFKNVVEDELQEIVKEWNTGKYCQIVFPNKDGLFYSEISNITKERCPIIYMTLNDLLEKYGFDTLVKK